MIKTLHFLSFILISSAVYSQDSLTLDQQYDLKTLPEYCDSFPTDKCSDQHGFVEIYEPLFAPIREDSIRFFEIGILNGVSHLMWRTYFRNAEIFGIDLRDYSRQSQGSGIMTFVADQSNRNDLNAFLNASGGRFDVILDDGGHAMDHQQVSLGYLFPNVDPGGMFIIEDVHTSLPAMYPDSSFKVNDVETNTTLLMLETFVRTGRIYSNYLSKEEALYLEENIERIELHFRKNKRHSIVCVIHKKELIETE